MPVIRPLPRPLTRILSFVIVLGWAGTMAVLVNAAYFRPSAMLAADLSPAAHRPDRRNGWYRNLLPRRARPDA